MDHGLVPTKFEQFIVHKDIASNLANINKTNITHTLFYGKANSGKKTLVQALLNNMFNTDIKSSCSLHNFELKIGNNKVNIDYISSLYHIEINLYEYGLYDKNIISDFIEDYVRYGNINKGFTKYIVLNHFEYSTITAQQCLRQILDSEHLNTIFILISEEITKIDRGILSQVSQIRVPAPTKEHIHNYIEYLSTNYHTISKINKQKLIQYGKDDLFIITKAYADLRWNKKLDFTKIDIVSSKIQEIIKLINKPNIQSVLEIRRLCYNLLLINVSMKQILKGIYNDYITSNVLTETNKFKLTAIAAEIEYKQSSICHDIICLEFFILKVKKLLLTN
jgi:DNA polymerase III delta prime subunit